MVASTVPKYGYPSFASAIRIPDHVRNPSRLLLVPRVVSLALVTGQVQDGRFPQEREEVAHEERGHERVPPVNDFEQPQGRLAGVCVGSARCNQRPVLPDLLRALDAGQLAQLVKCVRRRQRVDDVEHLHTLETFSREKLDVIRLHSEPIARR